MEHIVSIAFHCATPRAVFLKNVSGSAQGKHSCFFCRLVSQLLLAVLGLSFVEALKPFGDAAKEEAGSL
jgi:hypothetical protein